MEFRRGPYNSLLFFGFLGILFFFSHEVPAQCAGTFTFQAVSSGKDAPSGKIEVSVQNPAPGTYTFKVYEMNGTIAIVQTKQASTPDKVTFENLKASTYFVKVEWGQSCQKTLGGLEGIIITEKDQGR